MPAHANDPWSQVEDLDGRLHYHSLNIDALATHDDIKRAYRRLARQHHPDKGGDARQFAALQAAVAVLGDPAQRRVYDMLAAQTEWRYVPRATHQSTDEVGAEGALLDEFEALTGLVCDPLSQLVVTCEVCRRPATKECWICTMPICEFCTRKQHWKANFPLHWPLVNSSHMLEKLGRRELEQKRLEDAQRQREEDPHYRSESQLRVMCEFQDAAARAAGLPNRQVRYSSALAKYYMWAQTDGTVFLACHVPTGRQGSPLIVELEGAVVRVQSPGSLPAIERLLAYEVDPSSSVDTVRTPDNCFVVALLRKAKPGVHWQRLFRGDSDAVRCLQQPYRVCEGAGDEVVVELPLPSWVEPADCSLRVEPLGMVLDVHGHTSLARRFWRDRSSALGSEWLAVLEEKCTWVLDGSSWPLAWVPRSTAAVGTPSLEQPQPIQHGVAACPADAVTSVGHAASSTAAMLALAVLVAADRPPAPALAGNAAKTAAAVSIATAARRTKTLTITLVRPPPTTEELQYKKGMRQDNRTAARADGRSGWRFFADDEDEFGLEVLLQAHMFVEAGWAAVQPTPWGRNAAGETSRVTDLHLLPKTVQQYMESLRKVDQGAASSTGARAAAGAG